MTCYFIPFLHQPHVQEVVGMCTLQTFPITFCKLNPQTQAPQTWWTCSMVLILVKRDQDKLDTEREIVLLLQNHIRMLFSASAAGENHQCSVT